MQGLPLVFVWAIGAVTLLALALFADIVGLIRVRTICGIACVIAVFFLLSTSANAKCIANDSWRGQDKAWHFEGGAAIGAVVTMHTGDRWEGFKWGVIAAGVKELGDATGSGQCSAQDFAVTALGAAVGAYTGGLIVTKAQGRTLVAWQGRF